MLFAEGFEEITMGAEAVLTGNRIFENNLAERHKSKGHIGTEENKAADCREIGSPIGNRRLVDDGSEDKLGANDCSEKSKDVDGENRFFANSGIRVKNYWNKESENKEARELGGEIIGIFAINETVYEAPEEGRGDSDFDVFPSGFINGGEEAENFVFVAQIIEKVSEGAKRENNNDADNGKKRMVHGDIIALER